MCWCHCRASGAFSNAVHTVLQAFTSEARTGAGKDAAGLLSHCPCPSAGLTKQKSIPTDICLPICLEMYSNRFHELYSSPFKYLIIVSVL